MIYDFIRFCVITAFLMTSSCQKKSNYDKEIAEYDATLASEEAMQKNETSQFDNLPKIKMVGPTGNIKMFGILPVNDDSKTAPMAEYIRQSGFNCDSVISLGQLIEDKKPIDIFKIDCSNNLSLQATILDGKSYIKPWTGTLFGS